MSLMEKHFDFFTHRTVKLDQTLQGPLRSGCRVPIVTARATCVERARCSPMVQMRTILTQDECDVNYHTPSHILGALQSKRILWFEWRQVHSDLQSSAISIKGHPLVPNKTALLPYVLCADFRSSSKRRSVVGIRTTQKCFKHT
jgi:hypothetical protein